ncbi:helicase RepA family protein, partial [Acidobacteria bacterium AH-259-D05]|nr:helicase RepA family protein [Acidobacteria bacterium AH-259-D05]
PLTDAAAWSTFPFHDYELVIIDSLDATAEGVGEQDSRQPSKAIAPILDIAHRADGPAILVLGNTIKSAQHSRGSGVVEDRADIVFEVRDATDLQPSGTKDWWLELPPSGAEEWAKRASRRKKRDRYKLAFVPSKFRVGEEPEPFLLEVDLSGTPWGLQDVTDAILQQGKEALNRKQQEHEARLASAAEELIGEVEAAAQLEKTFIAEQDGVPFLMECGLKRKEARQLIKDRNGVSWRIETLKKERGRPRVLVPLTHLQGDVLKGTAAENEDPENPLFKGVSDPPLYAAPMDTGRRKTTIPKPLPDKGFSDSRFTPPTSGNSPDPSPGEGEKGEYWEGQLE